MYKILCIGPQWRGSDAAAIFRGFSASGHLISVVDEFYHIPLMGECLSTKVLQKLQRKLFIKEFNIEILRESRVFRPDIVFVFKGTFVKRSTLVTLKKEGYPLVNFYPDVSFMSHGPYLKEALPEYDHIFTTKSFGLKDMKEKLGITRSSFIPHGFDPEIHRPVDIGSIDNKVFSCDVSFIGGYSSKKEQMLAAIKKMLPKIDMKIWGPRWEQAKNKELVNSIQNRGVFGDLYALAIGSSKINLALLHERVTGSSSGDKITSRTFHIPAAGGFMIHERTEEVLNYFKENEEIVCFNDKDELVEKVRYFLDHPEERERIRVKGHERAMKDHSFYQRANQIIKIMQEKNII